MICTTKYDENSDIGTTYLGTSKIRRLDEWKTKHKMPITEDSYIPGKLLDGTDCKALLNMGASKSFMFKTSYLNCPPLHSLPNFYPVQRIF